MMRSNVKRWRGLKEPFVAPKVTDLPGSGAILFRSLPLGTGFRYLGGKDVWVVMERNGYGLIVKLQCNVDFAGPLVACADNSEEAASKLMVELVDML